MLKQHRTGVHQNFPLGRVEASGGVVGKLRTQVKEHQSLVQRALTAGQWSRLLTTRGSMCARL